MANATLQSNHRTAAQLREHYEIEKALAHKLRTAPRSERGHLYSSLYDELYRRVPLHPQLTRKSSPREKHRSVSEQMTLIAPFLRPDTTFLEIGPGDCALSFEVARLARQVYAVDVSDAITKSVTKPPNFHLLLSDGVSIPSPPGEAQVAYSNQLMEHLHPDDALEQLAGIYNALSPGGVYICITPNRLSGPHDISKYFDTAATGFHLKEYTTRELGRLFRSAGFSRVSACIRAGGRYISLPAFPIVLCEMLLNIFPHTIRRTLARHIPFRILLGIRLIGMK